MARGHQLLEPRRHVVEVPAQRAELVLAGGDRGAHPGVESPLGQLPARVPQAPDGGADGARQEETHHGGNDQREDQDHLPDGGDAEQAERAEAPGSRDDQVFLAGRVDDPRHEEGRAEIMGSRRLTPLPHAPDASFELGRNGAVQQLPTLTVDDQQHGLGRGAFLGLEPVPQSALAVRGQPPRGLGDHLVRPDFLRRV